MVAAHDFYTRRTSKKATTFGDLTPLEPKCVSAWRFRLYKT